MEVLSGPWANLALLLRQTVGQTDGDTDSSLPTSLLVLVLFLSVPLLMMQLIVYLRWKVKEVEDEISESVENRSAIHRPMCRTSLPRRRRSVG